MASSPPRINLDAPPPPTKISAVLLSYAQPLLKAMNKQVASTQQFRGLIALAAATWNATLAADMGNASALQALYTETLKHSPRSKPALDDLVRRRRTMFANDPRMIGDFNVKVSFDGTFSVTAAAVIPGQLMDEKPSDGES